LVRLKLTYDDLKDCLEALSFEAIQNDAPKEELLALYVKMQGYGKLKELMGRHGKVKKTVSKRGRCSFLKCGCFRIFLRARRWLEPSLFPARKVCTNSLELLSNHLISFLITVLPFIARLMSSISKWNIKRFMSCLWILVRTTAPHAKGVKMLKWKKLSLRSAKPCCLGLITG